MQGLQILCNLSLPVLPTMHSDIAPHPLSPEAVTVLLRDSQICCSLYLVIAPESQLRCCFSPLHYASPTSVPRYHPLLISSPSMVL